MSASAIKEPKVVIIVLNWNGRDLTLQCLHSLANLNYSNHSIVVVDNGSDDGSVDAVKEHHPGVTIIENERNLRWAGGNNVGIEYALDHGADYTLLLNNDTVVDSEMVSELVKVAEKDDSAGILGPKIYYHDRLDLIWYAGGRISWWRGLIWHVGIREQDRGQYDRITDVDYITGCAMMIRRAVVQQIGEIDTDFIAYGEDVDFSLRANNAGYRLIYVPTAVMWHKVSAYWGIVSFRKIFMKIRSNLILFRRYAPVWSWFTTIPLFTLLDAIRVVVLVIIGKIRS